MPKERKDAIIHTRVTQKLRERVLALCNRPGVYLSGIVESALQREIRRIERQMVREHDAARPE